MPFIWLLVAIVFAVLEVATVAFFAAFLAVGALAAALAAAVGLGPVGQAIVFLIVSVLGLVAARPYALKRLQRHRGTFVSGAPAMIGQQATVVDPIADSSHPGHVLIAGERWPAITGNGTGVDAGATVVVLEIRQSTLIVAPL